MAEGLLANFLLQYPDGPLVAVRDLRIEVEAGKVTVLFGASGSGKTSVLRVLAGLVCPDSGQIVFQGETWFDSNRAIFLPPQERTIGFVSQDYALFPHLTIFQNIAYGLGGMVRAEREKRVRESLAWLGLEELSGRRPAEISGGQQQRAALARAVVRRPKLLLLDEPLAALDTPTRRQLRGELHTLLSRAGIPAVVVTHDPAEALALANTLVLFHEGEILQSGAPYDLFNRPASIEAARILGVDSVVGGVVESCEDQLAGILAGMARLQAFSLDPLPSGTPVSVCIRAEDVTLTHPGAPTCSARNCLTGIVSYVAGEGGLVRVGIDCGFPLRAVLTRQSFEEMGLRPGSLVEARIKAPNVHLIPRIDSSSL